MIFWYHIINSSSISAKSDTGSPVPASVILPDESIPPEQSTTCNNASDCAAIDKNWFPRPLPFHASFINPGKSISSIGIYLHPSTHFELFGSSCTLNSGCTHNVIAFPVDVLASFVVKGYDDISDVSNVAELKKVVFPVLVFPIIPILIVMSKNYVDDIYL